MEMKKKPEGEAEDGEEGQPPTAEGEKKAKHVHIKRKECTHKTRDFDDNDNMLLNFHRELCRKEF